MQREQFQCGIPILMTDKRTSQVSHSSWRTKDSHNKSRLIPGLWASPATKTKRWLLLTKASYYSREPHVALLSIKLHPAGEVGLGRSHSLNLRKSKGIFSFTLPSHTAQALSVPFSFLLSHYFHLLPPLQLQTSLSSPRPRNGVIGSGGRAKKAALLPFASPSVTPPWPYNNPSITWVNKPCMVHTAVYKTWEYYTFFSLSHQLYLSEGCNFSRQAPWGLDAQKKKKK